ncbi:SRPBCC family protein [Nocardia salmonicida]|uniref:SRPBCC family protein n=1 Tax=Nocardia salmonicida TaxID=53431 RepID=UPI00379292D2
MAKQTVSIEVRTHRVEPSAAFGKIVDLASYSEHADVVKEISVEVDSSGAQLSHWSVWFRNGLLQWTERDVVDTSALTLEFEQVTGDLALFSGGWRVDPIGAQQVRIRFDAEIDLGIPSLAELLDPLALRALTTNTRKILEGLFGPDLEVVR